MQIKINCTFFLFDNINSMKLILPQYKTMPYNDKNLNHKAMHFTIKRLKISMPT